MKAFAYLRVSGKGQVDGDGFPRQIAAITAYAAAHDLEIVHVFEEKGITGEMEAEDRPAWAEMLVACREQGVTVIVIERLDRLARELMVQETVIKQARLAGFDLISTAEPDLLSKDPTRVMLRQIVGAVAEYDKNQIVAKLRGARQRAKLVHGRCEGAKPYGEHPDHPEELPTLQRMLALQRHGLTLTDIAQQLNREQLRPRRGSAWFPMSISRILSRHINDLGQA